MLALLKLPRQLGGMFLLRLGELASDFGLGLGTDLLRLGAAFPEVGRRVGLRLARRTRHLDRLRLAVGDRVRKPRRQGIRIDLEREHRHRVGEAVVHRQHANPERVRREAAVGRHVFQPVQLVGVERPGPVAVVLPPREPRSVEHALDADGEAPMLAIGRDGARDIERHRVQQRARPV